jgi:prepilin-type N-terminal cleavage/methylation domain-containing protein
MGGFTFIELILVIAIVGVLFTIAAISFRGLMPKYYLRTSARAIATLVESLRLSAVTRGVWMGIHYELTPPGDERTYHEVVPPAPEDDPDQPIEERTRIGRERTAPGVRIARVVLPNSQTVDRGPVNILFSPMGNAGSHIVVLEGEEGRLSSVKLNCITGTVEVLENVEASFQHFVE